MTSPAIAPEFPSDADWQRLPAHPRLFADEGRLTELRAQHDLTSKQFFTLLQNDAEAKLATELVAYPSESFLLFTVREAQGRILTLAMQYCLTGDLRCLQRVRTELRQLAALPEWYPAHFLDTGEAALAAGIGLDWLYDDLTPSERDHIAQAIV